MLLRRNKFNLSHTHSTTCDMGELVPVMCKLALPGDSWRMSVNCVMRVAPLLAPLMHNVRLYFHTFAVPIRILLNESEWESFITGGVNGDDASVLPTITFENGINVGELGNYLGFAPNEPAFGGDPARTISNYTVSALPFRAYALIYNEWYRNQNVQDLLPISKEMGPDTTTNTKLMNRNWQKDYFTRMLPWQQRGPDVQLPLGKTAPVIGNGIALGLSNLTGLVQNNTGAVGNLGSAYGSNIATTGSLGAGPTSWNDVDSVGITTDSEKSGLIADLSQATGSSVSQFYLANLIQRFMQKQAVGGARLVETLLSQFGVRSSDARLQRPEYLGGGVSNLVVMPVLQTSSTDTVSPQGNMAGQAFSAQHTKQFTHFFEEHSIVMTLMSIMPDTMYFQGTPREWLYKTRYDFPWPILSHAPEQAVFEEELFATGTASDQNTVGFVPRYDECRRFPSRVSGEFTSTLNYWNMARKFANAPELNSEFITSDPTKRINAVTDEDNCWCNIYFDIKAKRPLPKSGTPSLKAGV